MPTAEELINRIDYRFESTTTQGVYSFIIRRDDSPTSISFSVECVMNPNGEKVSSFPASVQTDIQTALAAVQGFFTASFDVTPVGPLTFTAVYEGPDPDSQDLTVSNDGNFGSLLNFTVSADEAWVFLIPDEEGGIRPNTSVTVTVSPITGPNSPDGPLAVGAHSSTVTFVDPDADDTPVTVTVDVTILPKAEISLSDATLSFTTTVGGPNPADQTFDVENIGPGTSLLNYTVDVAESSATWLTVSPTSGGPLGPGPLDTITVSVDVTGLTAGTYLATIRVTDPTAENSPQAVVVDLVLT